MKVRSSKRTGLVSAALALVLAVMIPRAGAMTEAELVQLYLEVVESAVDVYEPLWCDDSVRVPGGGFFDVRGYGNWTPGHKGYAGVVTVPANGMIAFCYAVLLTETDQSAFGRARVPRSVLLDHARRSIRWCCLTSVYVEHPIPFIFEDTNKAFLQGKSWRRKAGYRADVVGWLTLAAAILWDELDADTRRLVEDVMVGGAIGKRQERKWQFVQAGNHDQVKQDMSSTMGAAFMFPRRTDSATFMDAVREDGIDLVATLHDRNCGAVADGSPVSEWARDWNLYQDYTSDHHGWAQIWYGSDLIFEGRLYIEILARLAGRPVPETFTYPGNGFDGVAEWVKRLYLPPGEPASVHGVEYDSYYGSGLLAYAYGAVHQQDPVAAAMEERAALLLRRHCVAVPQYDYHRNSWAKAGVAYLLHRYGGGRAQPLPPEEAWRRMEGVYHHRWQRNLIHRGPGKFASVSWGSISSARPPGGNYGNGVCGFVVPAGPCDATAEPLLYLHPSSLFGNVTVEPREGKATTGPRAAETCRYSMSDDGMHTAGVLPTGPVRQHCAFFSFEDGPCVFFNEFIAEAPCRMDWSGMATYFFAREGLTSPRTFHDAGGEAALEETQQRRSGWWCVEDRLAVVAAGDAKTIEIARSVGMNWARTEAYRDRCDGVFLAPVHEQELRAGESCGRLAAAIYPNTTHAEAARAKGGLSQTLPGLPDGWEGIVAPDAATPARRYLAVANLHGRETRTTLVLSCEEGAPVLDEATIITGKTARIPVELEQYATLGESIELYVESFGKSAVLARRVSAGRYRIEPLDGPARIRVRFVGAAASGSDLASRDGRVLVVREPMEIVLEAEDEIGPAVEIEDLVAEDDGRLSVCVRARDRSGIAEVVLYCDGAAQPARRQAPYTWEWKPGAGYHTLRAVARDDSRQHNVRESFLRTLEAR